MNAIGDSVMDIEGIDSILRKLNYEVVNTFKPFESGQGLWLGYNDP